MTIDISRAWARTPSATALEAGGFLTLTNKAGETDRLVAAASPVAGKIAIRGIKITGPTMTMRPIEGGLGLPPDTAITMKPRGYHLFFEDLKAPLAKGDKVPVTLTFIPAARTPEAGMPPWPVTCLSRHAPGPRRTPPPVP